MTRTKKEAAPVRRKQSNSPRKASQKAVPAAPKEVAAAPFVLPEDMTIQTVEELVVELRELSPAGGVLLLDAGRVENITTPGIQLLLSLEETLNVSGDSLRLINTHEGQDDPFIALGLGGKWQEWTGGGTTPETGGNEL